MQDHPPTPSAVSVLAGLGMLLAGADPTDAVRPQLILPYALLGGVATSALVATGLAYRNFFAPAQQLRELD